MLPLKEATSEKHRIAERMPFNVRMFKGELDKQAYLHYLVQQQHLFDALESGPLPHPALNRSVAVGADITELLAAGAQRGDVLESTMAYGDYLRGLNQADRLPHVYLHYLALMFGGQMMKSKVPSAGKIYDFEQMQDALTAVRQIQQDSWAGEVNKGFDYTIAIFEALEALVRQEAGGAV
ncbi:MAG: biliverdin-producing heme oxygenase [Saprospiraceae bacterium]